MTPLMQHIEKWKDCQACPLAQQRFRICLGRGDIPCDVLFVGEAPGASEDAVGLPFVGPAGQLLDQIVDRILTGLQVKVALTNLVCCFPREAKDRGENEPEYSEIMACKPRLSEFINVAQPRLIVSVGRLAEQYVPHRMTMKYHHITHPAAMLKMPLAKRQMESHSTTVSLRNAVRDMLQQPRQPFTPFEVEHAEVKTRREQLREVYGVDSEIPW